jgi:peptidoglycan/xylan/chitin deacetylase (PgdA/CDA1 family)/glycosyltransferase involved in cell wall biosynthesis/SAM-dependent methyltransferase
VIILDSHINVGVIEANTVRVSILCSFLNEERFLEEAIDSVWAQTFPHWELFLIDDGSSDRSTAMAKKMAHKDPFRVRYLEHPGHANLGQAASRNLGLASCSGEFIAIIDGDDVWFPTKLAEQVAIMDENPHAALVFGAPQYWASWTGLPDDQTRDVTPAPGMPGGILYESPILATHLYPLGTRAAPCPSDMLLRRQPFYRLGGFVDCFAGPYISYEDQAFLSKIYLNEAVFISQRCWCRYRIREDSCCAKVKQEGRYVNVRRYFLDWLTDYFKANDIRDTDLWNSLQEALWPYKHLPHLPLAERARWCLRVAHGNEANLVFPSENSEMVRIDIKKATTKTSFDIQLNQPRLKVKVHHQYTLSFQARAERPRSITVGFAQAHQPWSNLGLYRQIDLTPCWQSVDGDFIATEDNDNARIHFDVGGSDIAVELASVGLFLKNGSPVPSGVQFGALRRVTPISRMWGYDRGVPIDRYFIEKFLGNRAVDVRGRVLEIEDNLYTYQFGEHRVTKSDILHVVEGNPKATIIGDLTDAPHIPDGIFDCIILTQTLQLIYDFRSAIATLYRILKPGGVLLATFPGITQNNDRDWSNDWYWSFTPLAARRLFGEAFPAAAVEVETFGNVLTAMSFLHGISAGELTRQELDYVDRGYEVTIGVRAIKEVSALARPAPTIQSRDVEHGKDEKALILIYHRVADAGSDPFSLCVSPRHFAEQLEVVREQTRAITLQQLSGFLRQRRIPERSVVITFDDGYVDNLQNARPLLRAQGIPATLFVMTGNLGEQREFWWDEVQRIFLEPGVLPESLVLFVQETCHRWELGESARYTNEEYLRYREWRAEDSPPTGRHSLYLTIWRLLQLIPETDRRRALDELAALSGSTRPRDSYRCLEPEELMAMAAGGLIEIGAHTVTHPALRELPLDTQQWEIVQSKHYLEQILGSPVTSFAYPYGAMSGETAAILGSAGFDRACTTVPRAVRKGTDRYRMPRFQVEDWDGEEFSRRLAGWFEKGMAI